jgi:hypothetical protein
MPRSNNSGRPPTQSPPPPPADDKMPVHTIRHRSLKASIWKNQTEKGPMYKVTVVRSYREGETWHDTHSFGFDELMNVAKLFGDAHSYITTQRAADEAEARVPYGAAGPHR